MITKAEYEAFEADLANQNTVTISQEEYDYLCWFRSYADFGPGHGDVIYYMHEDYKSKGRTIPAGWGDEE